MASPPVSTRVAALTAFSQSFAVKKVWLVILAVALALRLVALSLTWGRGYVGDPAAYMTLAHNLIAGHGFGLFGHGMEQKALFPPLYPFLLAAVGSVFPLNQPTIFALNFAIDLAAAWVIAQLARELGFKPLLAVAIYLLWPSNVLFVSTPNKEGLTSLLCVLAAWFAVRKAPVRFGLASGLLALTQPGLATLPAFFAILLRVPILVSAGIAALVMLPWWIRNYIVLGTFVPLTTASGASLWEGTFSPNGYWLVPPKRLLVGDELRFSQVSAAEAWAWIKAHPSEYARHTLGKLVRAFGNGWWPMDRLTRMDPPRPALFVFAPISIALTATLTSLGIAGGIVARSIVGKLLLACLLQMALVSLWFEFSERHTYFAIPFLALGIQALWASRSAPVISGKNSTLPSGRAAGAEGVLKKFRMASSPVSTRVAAVMALLRSLRPSRDAIVQILPKFDRRSRAFYALVAASILFTSLSLAATGIDVSRALQFDSAIFACFFIFVATMLRRGGRERISTGLETIALLVVMAVALVGLQYPLAAVSGPMVDAALLRADRAMGFDWLAFARLFHDPAVLDLLKRAYLSMSLQGALVLAVLSWRGDMTRAWQFATATFVLFLVSVLLFPIFPADGRFVLCGLRPPDIPVIGNFCLYGPVLHHLKDGSLRVIDPSMAVGMVTFPSAHAAAGLLLIWAVWPIRLLRLPFVILNIALCVGAIVIGSHYLIDIWGGAVVAAASIFAARKLVRSSPGTLASAQAFT